MSLPLPDSLKLSHKFLFLSLALIILIGFLTYANSLKGQFLWDDESLVQFNPYIKDWSLVPEILTTGLGSTAKQAGSFYRPAQTISYLVDYSLWRLNVVGYHSVNVGLHILAALSLYFLVYIIFRNGKLSLLTALLFVTHPIHTEAVSYISGRADSLAALFMFLSYILYLRHYQKGGLITLSVMVLCYLLALFSRENSLILPFLVCFYHFTFKKSVDKKALIVLFGTLLGYILWRGFIIGMVSVAEGVAPTFSQRLPGIFVALTNYFRLLLLPFDLHMEYGGILFSFSEPKSIIGIILLVFLLVFVFRKREQDPFLFFSTGWFFIALLPSSNLFFPINAYMAEHWLYVPSIGFFLIVARFLVHLSENQKFKGLAFSATIGLVMFYSVLTIRQNRYWNNGINFYQKMLQYAPDSSRLYNNLAKAYHDAGKNDELIKILKSAIQLQPDNALAHNNLGNAYKELGKYKESEIHYKKAIKIDPQHAGPYYNLSTIYADILEKKEEAISLLNKAIELSPYFSKSYNKLGLLYLEQGKKDKAIALLEKARELNPDDPEVYHNLGYLYIQLGDQGKAKSMYKKALEVNPNYVEAYHDLSIIYHSEGNYRLAIEYCDQSVAMGYADSALLEALKPYR